MGMRSKKMKLPKDRTPLELLVVHREQNIRVMEAIEKGQEPGEYDCWYIVNEELNGKIPTDVYEKARQLRRQRDDWLLKCQTGAFGSHAWVKELNDKDVVKFQYDPDKSFSKNISEIREPLGPKGPGYGMPMYVGDEIATEAVERFESHTLVTILKKLDKLYEKAIKHLQNS